MRGGTNLLCGFELLVDANAASWGFRGGSSNSWTRIFLIFGRFFIMFRSLASSVSSSSVTASHFDRFRDVGVEEPGRFWEESDMVVCSQKQSNRGGNRTCTLYTFCHTRTQSKLAYGKPCSSGPAPVKMYILTCIYIRSARISTLPSFRIYTDDGDNSWTLHRSSNPQCYCK